MNTPPPPPPPPSSPLPPSSRDFLHLNGVLVLRTVRERERGGVQVWGWGVWGGGGVYRCSMGVQMYVFLGKLGLCIYMCMRSCVGVGVCTCICMDICVCVCMCVCIHVYMYEGVYMYMYMYMCVCMCVYVYMYMGGQSLQVHTYTWLRVQKRKNTGYHEIG